MLANGSSPGATPDPPALGRRLVWLTIEWGLFAVWIADAALVMAHRHVGFFTNHAADLTLPAWLYVITRKARHQSVAWWRRWLVCAPPVALAILFFAASTATEICQYFWPHGLFPGTFDPLDILSYGIGLGVCCAVDLFYPIPARN